MNPSVNNREFLFVEKYRPKTIADCILPVELQDTFEKVVKTGQMQNMIFAGRAGCGKTTVAKALANDMGYDCLFINASEESGIDVLRTKIRNYASTVSVDGSPKVVILDEADFLNPNSTQPALRSFIEEFSKSCRFIFTCNQKNRIIEPLHSRCTVFEFTIPKAETKKIAAAMFERCQFILDTEKIAYKGEVLAQLIVRHFPDFRRVLGEIQRYSYGGKIDEGILANVKDASIGELVDALRTKNFKEARRWLVENADDDTNRIFRRLYDSLKDIMTPQSVPAAVLIIAEYMYKAAFVTDAEINAMACFTQLMAECEFRKG